ncbi:hypothetical protein [Natranaerobius thermophilus]|uniref:Uncharacterized protein n=2 Tax=Natranaerobius TaxID=375928 RepID=B2A220_NATTJ|nr:hypothetical protein [Natranaerobius thermophilus]ACB84825.1 hypothetical protein Nther_1242 [Natranaerobius thermophilus JW/NM-WN-LF]
MKIGKQGEKKVDEFLNNKKNIRNVIDVSDNEEYMEKGIDFLIETESGNKQGIEVKTDTYYSSGNFFLEYIANTNKNKTGALLSSHAKWLFYYFIDGTLYIFKLSDLKKWIKKNKKKYKKVSSQNPTYKSLGLLVSREELIEELNPSIYQIGGIQDDGVA